MRRLANDLLEPLRLHFGAPTLTYGFAGPSLTRFIKRRISPRHDQHAGHEKNRLGQPVCTRGGFAVDFYVPGTSVDELVDWMMVNRPIDRLYFYGADRPVHVSLGPDESRKAWWMREIGDGRRMPVPYARYRESLPT